MIEKIKEMQLQARKSGDKIQSSLLTTLLGELSRKEKDFVEDAGNVYSVIKKMIKDTKEFIDKLEDGSEKFLTLKTEVGILESLLPKQASVEEMQQVLSEISAGQPMKNMGLYVKALKEKFGINFDGRVAKQLFDAQNNKEV